jgi:uncharacterized membrane-anchored protein YitT (DUF2179 family)
MVYIKSANYIEVQSLLHKNFSTPSTVIKTEDSKEYADRKMVMAILKNKQIRDLQIFIHRIDPTAFVVIGEVFEIHGTPVEAQ